MTTRAGQKTLRRQQKTPDLYVAEPASRLFVKKVLPLRDYFQLIKMAITELKSLKGSSFPAIEKYLIGRYGNDRYDAKQLKLSIKRALKSGKLVTHPNHKFSYKLSKTELINKNKISKAFSTKVAVATKSHQKVGSAPKTKTKSSKSNSSTKAGLTSKKPTSSNSISGKVGSLHSAASVVAGALPTSSSSLQSPELTSGVDPESGLVGKGNVLVEGRDQYSIDMTLQDPTKNSNKFYRLQVIESIDQTQYWLVQHWGRIGTKGQCQVEGPTTKALAVNGLKEKYLKKAGKRFEDRDLAAVAGKYSSVLMREDIQAYDRQVLCIDTSGSMGGSFKDPRTGQAMSRLDFVKRDIDGIFTEKLNDQQSFTVIRFDTSAKAWNGGLQQATKPNLDAAIAHVKGWHPSGGTDFNAALDASFGVPGVQAVFLLSDGEVGGNAGALVEKARTLSKGGQIHCHTTSFFAANSGSKLLEDISKATNGTYFKFG